MTIVQETSLPIDTGFHPQITVAEYPQIDQALQRKLPYLQRIYQEPKLRERILRGLYESSLDIPPSAPVSLVFGTSPERFPEKFRARVKKGSELLLTGRTDYLIFSGFQDDEVPDTNQALQAANMAIQEFSVPPEKIFTVGGNNTEQNLWEASVLLTTLSNSIPPPYNLYLVSESHHLFRGASAAGRILKPLGIKPHPFPVDGVRKLDPNDPSVTRELIKAIGYNRLFPETNPKIREYIQYKIDPVIKQYERLLGLRN